MWIEPIFDRTEFDVRRASVIKKKIDKLGYGKLSESEKQEYLSEMIGTFSFITANRIEGNTAHIFDMLVELNYLRPGILTFKTWTNEDEMFQDDFERLKTNLATLSQAVDFNATLPGSMMLNIDVINKLEKCTADLKKWIESITDSYRYAGTEYAGDWW